MKKISAFFKKIKNWAENHKTLFALIVTVLFVIVQIPVLVNHEAWNDEAISWELSREITPGNIYELNSAEPHPLLWQIILSPFSKLGLPFETLGVISLLLVASAVFLLVRFAPMHFFVKFAFIISGGLFYYLPIISRDYSLVPLAICLVCIFYQSRHEKPLRYGLTLAFLTQTHFLMYGLAAALSIGFVFEEIFNKEKVKVVLKNVLIFSIPLIISLLTVIPIVIGSFENQAIITEKAFELVPEEYRDPFFPNLVLNFFGAYSYLLTVAFNIIVAALIFTLAVKNPKACLYFVAGEGFWLFTMANIYKGYNVIMPKVALIILILLAVIWIIRLENTDEDSFVARFINHSEIVKFFRERITKNTYIFITVIAAISTAPYAFNYMGADINMQFSNAKEVAALLDSLEPGSLYIEADTSGLINSAMREYMKNDITFYNNIYRRVEEKEDYLRYDNKNLDTYIHQKAMTNEELTALFKEMTAKYEHVYYAVNPPSCSSTTDDNSEVLDKYELVARLNGKMYLDVGRARVVVYKIK